MLRYSTHAPLRLARSALLCLGSLLAGCDPDELPPSGEAGPPFLIVAPAAKQPSSIAQGTSLYVQARGGDSIGILSHGCAHTYGGLPDQTTTSCASLEGSEPFTFLVFPTSADCVVEVRLYSSCDLGAFGANTVPLATCESVGALVTSVNVPVAGGGAITDGGGADIDSAIDKAEGSTDSAVDGAGDE